MTGPLSGFRIIDLTSMISGPIATRMLADQGADVIKVEAPGKGDLVRHIGRPKGGRSPTFATANRNKRSIVLNLKDPGGLDILKSLVKTGDVFVQNFRPGTVERMGIGEEVLREINPDLIYVSISGFGETGPYAHKRVYDPVIQALSGLASIQADRETGRPKMIRAIIPDKLTAVTASQAITAALLSRERTGEGQHVRLAMLDVMIAFLWPESMSNYTFIEEERKRSRDELAQDLVFETKDGYITVGAVTDAEWIGMAKATDHPEWIDDPRFNTVSARVTNVVARLDLTAEVIKTRTSSEWLERFDLHEVPSAPILSRDELLDYPQVIANELIVESEDPLMGPMRQARPSARFDKTPSGIRAAAPTLGQHTNEVLKELGIAHSDIQELRDKQIVA